MPLAGLLWWVTGFGHWILDGLGPVPAADTDAAAPDGATHPALPMIGSSLHDLVLGGIVGGLCGGTTAAVARHPRRLPAAAAAATGVALALTVTLVQSVSVLESIGDSYFGDARVLIGLSAVTVVASWSGWCVGAGVLAGSRGVAVALAVAAGAAPMWVTNLVAPRVSVAETGTVASGAPWVGGALLTAALVVIARRRPADVGLWPLVVAAAWVIGPVVTAAGYAEVYLRPGAGEPDLSAVLSASWDVFGLALAPSRRPVLPWIVALAVAAMLTAALHQNARPPARPQLLRRKSSSSGPAVADPD